MVKVTLGLDYNSDKDTNCSNAISQNQLEIVQSVLPIDNLHILITTMIIKVGKEINWNTKHTHEVAPTILLWRWWPSRTTVNCIELCTHNNQQILIVNAINSRLAPIEIKLFVCIVSANH
jgi:hypothetical protein